MAFKFVILAAALACANAGLVPQVATYSAAPAVSSAYIHQAAPAVGLAHAAPLAYAQAAPLSYAHAAPVAIHAPAIGASQQSVFRSLGGAQAVSHYSKAVDSPFSSVRKFDTRITNDALSVAHAPIATYAQAAPIAAYGQAAPIASYAHAAPIAAYGHAAPIASYAHAAPVAAYGHAAPVLAKSAIAYSPASVVSHVSFNGLGVNYGW